jgi:hypothetical protein
LRSRPFAEQQACAACFAFHFRQQRKNEEGTTVVQPINPNDARNTFVKEVSTSFGPIIKTNQPEQVNIGGQVEKKEPARKKQLCEGRDGGPGQSALGRAPQIVPAEDPMDYELLQHEVANFKEIIIKLSTKYPRVPIAQFLPGKAFLTDLAPPRDIRTFIKNFDAWEYRLAIGGIPRRGYHLPTLPL